MASNKREQSPGEAFQRLYDIIVTLRNPGGCPWDREQTPHTLRSDLVEETYECIEAIDDQDTPHIREELGDLFLLVTMISRMHEQSRAFDVVQVLNGVSDKLIRRHPHVFSDSNAKTTEEVLSQWDDIKTNLEGRKEKGSLHAIPRSLPPLERSIEIQKKVAKNGFDWDHPRDTLDKTREEWEEWAEILETDENQVSDDSPIAAAQREEELGDILFSLVNTARRYHINPVLALERTNRKFTKRFTYIEEKLKIEGKKPELKHRERMEQLWNEAKEPDSH